MNERSLKSKIELLIFISPAPIAADAIAKHLSAGINEVEAELKNLQSEYDSSDKGFAIRETKSGFSFYSKEEYSDIVQSVFGSNDELTLTKGALETLSIIAYKGPVSRSEIAKVRGVNSDFMVRNLLVAGLIEKQLNSDDGRTFLYKLSEFCFEQLGITDESELPPISPYLPPDLDSLNITSEFTDFRKKGNEKE